jgi:predicted flap endonuclease-1-like 5' DNA nuclease
MIYLIAQYAVVFLLAGLFGFLLGRWWARRSYVDVTESYETISRAAADAPWDRVWSRFDGVDQTVRGIVREELAALPQPEIPKVDLGGIESQLRTLEQRVANLPQPSEVDLDPLSKSIQDVDARIAALPAPRTPEPVNLAPLDHRIAAVEQAVRAIRIPEPEKQVDLASVNQRIDAVESALRSIHIPEAPTLEPVQSRLEIIDGKLTELVKRPSGEIQATAGPRLLKSATFGEKDDLKKISGVGPKLESMLNSHGIYYFWQVAEWTPADIKIIDDRLDVFVGRIERDDWVAQAKTLAKASTAATSPSGQPSSGEELRL